MSSLRFLGRLLALLLVTSGLSVGLASGAGASAPSAPARSAAPASAVEEPSPDPTPTVRGLVYDADGNLLDDIEVEAVRADDPTGEPVASDLTYEYQGAAQHGAYRLHVPAGTYKIRFSSPLYEEGQRYETHYYGGGAGEDVVVGDDLVLDDVTLVADTGVPVTGRVTVDGAGEAGVQVELARHYGDYTNGVAWTYTDADGNYTFPAVNRGLVHTVRALGSYTEDGDTIGYPDRFLGNTSVPSDAETFELASGSPGATVPTIDLIAGAQVSGTVLGEDGNPLSSFGAELLARAQDGTWDYVDWDCGGCEGELSDFRFPRVATGATYTIAFYSDYSGNEVVYLGGVASLDDATLQTFTPTADLILDPVNLPERSGEVTGSVLDQAGQAVPYAQVLVLWHRPGGTWSRVGSTWASEDGTFSARVPFGLELTLKAKSRDFVHKFLGDVELRSDATTFTVAEGDGPRPVGPIQLTALKASVTGLVLNGADPVAGAQAILWMYDPESDAYYEYTYTTTDAQGRYRFNRITVGRRVTVSVEKSNHGLARRFAGASETLDGATKFDLAAGQLEVGGITLVTAADTVSGTIDTSDGVPLDGYTYLELYDLDELVADALSNQFSEPVRSIYTYDDTYAFASVAPGDYAIFISHYPNAMSGVRNYASHWRGGGALTPTGPDSPGVFTVEAGTPATGINITLDRGIEISGTVTSAGSPVADAVVYPSVYTSPSRALGYGTSVDLLGHYQARVPTGSEMHSVSVHRQGYLSWVSPESLEFTGADQQVDVELSPDWQDVGEVAGQRLDYCLQRIAQTWNGRLVDFDGSTLRVDGGVIRKGNPNSAFDNALTTTRLPSLAPLGNLVGSDATYGISPDGDTLCFVFWGSNTVQVLLTKRADGNGLDVTYNYDRVGYAPDGSVAGYTDGEGSHGDEVVFSGGAGGGYQDDHPATALIGSSNLDPAVPGRFQFHFDGFEPRGAAPVQTRRPRIIGTPAVGETLTADLGAWSVGGVANPGDLELTPVWQYFDGQGQHLVASPTFTIPESLAGGYVDLSVRAWAPGHKPGYSFDSVDIDALPVAAANVSAPTLLPDEPRPGDVLTAEPGEWSVSSGAVGDLSFAYQWFRDGNRIYGNDGQLTYTVTTADQGSEILVRELASRADHLTVHADSAPVTVGLAPALVPTTDPTVSGTPKVGETLTVDPGAWPAGTGFSYRWVVDYRTRNADAGSGGLSYTLKPGDVGQLVTVYVTGSADGFSDGTRHVTTGPVADGAAALSDLSIRVVRDDDGTPVEGVWWSACEYETYTCLPGGTSNAGGRLSAPALASTAYLVYLYPPDGSTLKGVEGRQVVTPASGQPAETEIALVEPTPPPANVEIPTSTGTYNGDPVVYWNQAQEFNVTGCATITAPTYTVTFTDGTPAETGPMTVEETLPGGLVRYTATIPAFYPAHGETTISSNVPADCEPGTPATVVHIYIDPSGIVTDQYGRPLVGASVTLQRSDTAGGPYVAVPDGSTIMSPDNRANPSLTDATGFFRWDVTEGWYKVRAAATGCMPMTSDAMQVNPPRVDLLLKLTCDAAAPVVTPNVSGTGKVGTLLATTSPAVAAPLVAHVQWLADGAPIVGENGPTYQVRGADVGKLITARHTVDRPDYLQEQGRGAPVDFTAVSVTATGVTATAVDAPPPPPPTSGGLAATTAPVIAGSGKVATVLTSVEPVWDQSGVANAFQWMRGATPIAGATGPTYEVRTADLGQPLTLRVTGTKMGVTDGVTASNAIVAQPGSAPVATTAPSLDGTAKVGQSLTATLPTWDLGEVTTGLQWQRETGDGAGTFADIAGATGATYQLAAADAGKLVRVVATGAKLGHADGTSPSSAVLTQLGDAPMAVTGVSVSGVAKHGKTLSVVPGTWTGAPAFGYQWLRDGDLIAGATSSTYALQPADAGTRVSVLVTASEPGHAEGSALSPAVSVAKLRSQLSIDLVRERIKASQRGVVKLSFRVAGIVRPAGIIRIFDGMRLIKTVRMTSVDRGTLRAVLPKLGRGGHRLMAKYAGSEQVAGSQSKRVVLRVVR